MINAVWMRSATDLRVRWRGVVVLSLLLGIAGGVVMTAAAGARRTASAYNRLIVANKGYDAEVALGTEADSALLDRVAALPQVADHGRFVQFPADVGTPGSPPKPFGWNVAAGAIADERLGTRFEVPKIISGRLADYDSPNEAMINQSFVPVWARSVGDEFTLQLATLGDLEELFAGRFPIPTGPAVTIRIVGVISLPHDPSLLEPAGLLFLTPAFYRTYGNRAATSPVLLVRLKDRDSDIASFREGVRRIADIPALEVQTSEFFAAKIDRALGVQTTGLWVLAVVLAAGTALVLGHEIGRWLTLGADDHPILRALGMGPKQRTAVLTAGAAVIGLAGAAVAAAGSILASRLVPVGLARRIEPDPGHFADPSVLAVGCAAVFALAILVGWGQGMLLARRKGEIVSAAMSRRSGAAELLARSGLPATAATGVRFALESGRGRTAAPVRSALGGTVLAIGAVAAAFTFGRSLDHMLATPASYGWNWDLVAFGGQDPESAAEAERTLASSPVVGSFSRLKGAPVSFGGRDLEATSVEPIRGSLSLPVLEGRFPTRADEVALATKTMRVARLRIGDRATFRGTAEACGGEAGCPLKFRIVGRVIFQGEGADPDDGAAFAEPGWGRLMTDDVFIYFAVRAAPGTSATSAWNDLKRNGGLPFLPPSLVNVERVRAMPGVLAIVLAGLALATLTHVLVTSVRRRARELALLKTLGFVRRQVAAVIAWQATVTLLVATLIGLPLGLVAGRWTWSWTADRLGVAGDVATPMLWLGLGFMGALALANLVAAIPGRIAARTKPAYVLRAE